MTRLSFPCIRKVWKLPAVFEVVDVFDGGVGGTTTTGGWGISASLCNVGIEATKTGKGILPQF